MLLVLVLCAICPAVLSSNVHTVLPENYDTKPTDGDEYGVRNYVSDHELPRDVATRVKITGDLGTPPPSVKLDFVPQQTYVQVRRYDAVKRLPQEAAMEESVTSEELANAPRLREVVTHKKTQEVYEEQGYEDAGYDHGGSKKLKVEEEVKDNHSVEAIGPGSVQNTEETKDNTASVAPSGRGTWSRHKTTTGKKTRLEDNGDNKKVTTNDSSPISEKSSGNYTKFDGGKTIIVQNLTETVKKDGKKEGAESRRVTSFSKNANDNVEPTTYRPTTRRDSPRVASKQINNEQKRNRTRSRPRKRQENDVQKPQADVVGSYDHSPWIPMSPPADLKRPQSEGKKQVKSKINSELHEPNGHTTRYGYSVNHDMPYQYVLPADIIPHRPQNRPNFKFRTKPTNSDTFDGKPKGYTAHEYIPQTNYDGSAINPKKFRVKPSGDLSFDQINVPLNNKYKEPITNFKTEFTQNIKPDGSATNLRQKNKAVPSEFSEQVNSNIKIEPHREQKKKGHRDVGTELGNYGNPGSRYTGSMTQEFGPPKSYDAHFITSRPKKNNYNVDSTGDHTLRVVYPKYEFYPNFQNVKYSINKDEVHRGQRPLSNLNKGHANVEFNENPPRGTKTENTRLSEYSKFNNRPKNVHKQQSAESSEIWENYPKIKDQTAQLTEDKYSKLNRGEGYPKFDTNKRFEGSGTKSPLYRLVPYEKSVKINNPYSYVYQDDHYPSGSRLSAVKVEGTTQNPKLYNKVVYWNNRHPHLPKDSIKNLGDEPRGRDKSEDENTRHVENLTLAHYSGHPKSGSYRPLPLEYNDRVNNLAKLLNSNYPKRTRRDLEVINIASSGTTTEIPVDTVVYPHYKNAPKQSALRYATNPKLAPRKTAGGMEFYASTDNIQCNDMAVPEDIVPQRTDDGEWKGEPSSNNPRVDALGDKIGCFKTKFFGSDPLDNPIFKEKDVGLPEVLFSKKKSVEQKEVGIEQGKPHVDWNFADELIPSQWFPDKDKRNRRSDNGSLPVNHKIQGMASIMPEPVILTFPTKASMVVYTNETKADAEDSDPEVTSHDEHILKYSVKHPLPKAPESNIRKNHSVENKILGLVPPPQMMKKVKKQPKAKKPTMKKILKTVKVDDDESNEADLLEVLSPITSFFTDEDDAMTAPIVHNFFNIKMTPPAKLKTKTKVDKNSGEKVNRYYTQSYRRAKRNMKGVDLQKPKQRKLSTNANTNVTLSETTARVRMYTPKNGTWFRDKRDQDQKVNVDVRRKEPRYYYHTERPRTRVKRVVHNPPFHSRSGHVFSSKYQTSDQDNAETLPEEINVAFSTTPRYNSTPKFLLTPKFIPAIAFGDSKTRVIRVNDSVANSTNDVTRTQLDKKGSLIYVINPDTGLGKWMQVIKVKNEEDTKSALTNGPVYLEKKVKDGLAEETVGKFGFRGSTKDLFRSVLGSNLDHRFRIPNTKETAKDEVKEKPKKTNCPTVVRPKKKEIKRRTTTTTTTTEIPVEEDIDERPEEQSGEEETTVQPEDGEEGENEEEQPVEPPRYHHESEENPDNAEYEDQDAGESKRKKPYTVVKKPQSNGHFLGSRDKNKKIT